jgi:hypothetical protein
METVLYVSTALGVVASATLGIMYGLAAREVGSLTARVVELESSQASLFLENGAQRNVIRQNEDRINELEASLLDDLDIDGLVDYFNGLLPDGKGGDNN